MCSPAPTTPTSSTSSQTSIAPYAQPYVERMLGKSEALSNTPYQAYGGQRIADFSPMQQQAFQQVGNLQPAQQLGTATQMAGMAGLGSLMAGQNYQNMATNPYATQAYMSPYIQNALAPQMEEIRRQSDITGVQNAGQAVGAGAFGGSRFGLQEAERQRNMGTLQNQTYGAGMQNAFQNAQQAQQFGSTLGLQGLGQAGQMANTLGNLGQTQFGQQKDIINALSNAGGQQQGLQQQQMSQQYQDFLNQKNYPKEQLSWFADMTRGLPLAQSSQNNYAQPASLAGQVAGGVATAKGLGLFAEGGSVGNQQPSGLADLAIYNMG